MFLKQLKRDMRLILGFVVFLLMILIGLPISSPMRCIYFVQSISIFVMGMAAYLILVQEREPEKEIWTQFIVSVNACLGVGGIIIFILRDIMPLNEEMLFFYSVVFEFFSVFIYIFYRANRTKWKVYIGYKLLGLVCGLVVVVCLCPASMQVAKQRWIFRILVVALSSLCFGRLLLISKKVNWKIERKYSLIGFYIFKGIHYWGINFNLYKGSIVGDFFVLSVQLLYTYYLLVHIYYTYLKEPWLELIQEVEVAEQQIDCNAQERDMIVNLSHELKTPINVIQSAVGILKLDLKDDEACMKEVNLIRMECGEALKIICNMIDINKLRGNYLKLIYKYQNLVDIIENIVEAFMEERPNLSIIFDTNEEEVYSLLDDVLIQKSLVYLIATIIRLSDEALYIDLVVEKEEGRAYMHMYNKDIEALWYLYEASVDTCKDKQLGDVLALEFIRRLFALHEISIESDCDKRKECFTVIFKMREEEEVEVMNHEENIQFLREQIRSSYTA